MATSTSYPGDGTDDPNALLQDPKLQRAALARAYGNAPAAVDAATTAGMNSIRSQAANALAAGQASTFGRGHGGYGGALQANADSGLQQAQFGASQAMEKQNAQTGALESIGKMGSDDQNRQKKQAAYEDQIQAIIKANKGFFNDDETTMRAQIMQLANYEQDPEMRQYLMQRANNIATKTEDV